jgi:isopenicillin-N N-acyltransferase-like protein
VTVPVVRVEGDARRRGLEVGRALREHMHRSLDFYRGFMEARGFDADTMRSALEPYRDAAEATLPGLLREIDGMAEGAQASWWELFAVNSWEELEPVLLRAPAVRGPDRCTAFAFGGPNGTVLAHNEQWYAGDAGNVAVVVAVPDEGPPFVSPTSVACIPAVGMSSGPVAQGIMSLTARDDGTGIPRALVSRHSLQATGRSDAIARATIPGRAGGYAHVFAAPGEGFVVETSATRQAVLDGFGGHTNHYIDPELAIDDTNDAPGTRIRMRRLTELLDERRPAAPEEAMAILGDHRNAPESICLHPDHMDADQAGGVLFSMVCHLEERRMWVAGGNPCTEPFEEIDLTGALGT